MNIKLSHIFSISVLVLWGLVTDLAKASDTKDGMQNLMLVVRTSFGANRPDALLTHTGPQHFTDAEGNTQTINPAHFDYIGDTHIRFVFDSPMTMRNLTYDEFKKMGMSVDEAVALAMKNMYRDYGEPQVYPLEEGGFVIESELPDLNSAYFLDYSLWTNLATHFGSPLLVAVPARDVLLFAPLIDERGVQFLKENVQSLFKEASRYGVSTGLFLFKNDGWQVFQAPTH